PNSSNLKIFSWAVPYVHQNAAELVSNLVQLVGAGILSKETGSEESGYGKNNEWDRIMREYKEQQQADLLYQLKIKKNENKEGNAK
ncbi:phage portal protein, partial [Bacteroides fragilis]